MHKRMCTVCTISRFSQLESKLASRGGVHALYLEGWLWKRGQHTGVFNKRWCMLRADGLLGYTETQDAENLRGEIDLRGAKIAHTGASQRPDGDALGGTASDSPRQAPIEGTCCWRAYAFHSDLT